MLSVYLLHCEAYCGNLTGGGYGYWLSPFYVNAFFFVSGYLFFAKRLKLDEETLVVNLKKSYQNTFF